MKEELEKLKALQDLQNSQTLLERVELLEERLTLLQDRIAQAERTLSILSMDAHTTKLKLEDGRI